MDDKIKFYAWTTPNGYKISIFLEEAGLPYTVIPVNLGEGQQKSPAYLKLNPNGEMPTIIDPNGPDGKPITIFESGAILWYLAEKTGKLIPSDIRGKTMVSEWLFWEVSGLSPMIGQELHFRYETDMNDPIAIERYTKEVRRLYGVLETRLTQSPYLAGDDFTIADISTFTWSLFYEKMGVAASEIPHTVKWIEKIMKRPGVKAGMELLSNQYA